MPILIEMINAVSIEEASATFNTVDDIAFIKQKLS
jgi:hypothetical protein